MKKDDSENRRVKTVEMSTSPRLGEMYLLSESLTLRRQLDIIGAAGDSANEGRCAGNDEAAESRPICG